MNLRYRLDITLCPGTNFDQLMAAIAENSDTETNNQNYSIRVFFQDFKMRSGSISFTVTNEEAMRDFCRRIQSEGIPVQSFLIQKIDWCILLFDPVLYDKIIICYMNDWSDAMQWSVVALIAIVPLYLFVHMGINLIRGKDIIDDLFVFSRRKKERD